MHNRESILENEMYEVLYDFAIQTNHLISIRPPDLMIVNKKENLLNSGLCRPGGAQSKNQRKQKER